MKRAPLILAIVLLTLPILYVGSYLALVVPKGQIAPHEPKNGEFYPFKVVHYRVLNKRAILVFRPLEQIDRKVRPNAWLQDGDYRTMLEQHWIKTAGEQAP